MGTDALLADPMGLIDSSIAHCDAPDLNSWSPAQDLESHALSMAHRDVPDLNSSSPARDWDSYVLSMLGSETLLAAMSAGGRVSSPMLGNEALLAAMSADGTGGRVSSPML